MEGLVRFLFGYAIGQVCTLVVMVAALGVYELYLRRQER